MKAPVIWLGAMLLIGGLVLGYSDFTLDTYRNIRCGEAFGGISNSNDITVAAFCGQVRAVRGAFAVTLLFLSFGPIIGGLALPRSRPLPPLPNLKGTGPFTKSQQAQTSPPNEPPKNWWWPGKP